MELKYIGFGPMVDVRLSGGVTSDYNIR